MWKRREQERVRHRVVLKIAFDIENPSTEVAAERVQKIVEKGMPWIMERLGPWLTSKHRQIELVEVIPLDAEEAKRAALPVPALGIDCAPEALPIPADVSTRVDP